MLALSSTLPSKGHPNAETLQHYFSTQLKVRTREVTQIDLVCFTIRLFHMMNRQELNPIPGPMASPLFPRWWLWCKQSWPLPTSVPGRPFNHPRLQARRWWSCTCFSVSWPRTRSTGMSESQFHDSLCTHTRRANNKKLYPSSCSETPGLLGWLYSCLSTGGSLAAFERVTKEHIKSK